ncbi:zinc finger protein 84-like isoform X1 [Salvelinus namaycush]|uniref:Zinc finger protein 84-like isoform X1 n=2 Tax=Salvelinus namaycush TaxID=8040 RepID=A0A8U0Q779_SALNM|nr:zinc finger protein 84-like isoform X1 [Salvelinus namaycush]XP_038837911.1 zinc finger protein 84-like isoform X1 [Salvelinus namaycush]
MKTNLNVKTHVVLILPTKLRCHCQQMLQNRHLTLTVSAGGLSLEDDFQAMDESQSEAYHSSTAEPEEEDTSQDFSVELEMWVKSEPGSEGDTVSFTPSVAENKMVDLLTGREMHACSYCNKRFNYRSQVIIHERVHTRERPFVCKQCGKGFSQINNLKKHQLCHRGGESRVRGVWQGVLPRPEPEESHGGSSRLRHEVGLRDVQQDVSQ